MPGCGTPASGLPSGRTGAGAVAASGRRAGPGGPRSQSPYTHCGRAAPGAGRGAHRAELVVRPGRTSSSVIPYAAQLDQSANEGRPFVMTRKDNPAARAIFQLASTVAEVRTPKQYERQLWTG